MGPMYGYFPINIESHMVWYGINHPRELCYGHICFLSRYSRTVWILKLSNHDKPALAFFRWVPRAVPEEVGRKIPIVKASASHRKKCRGPVTAAVVEVSTMSRARQAKRAVAAWRPQRSGRQTRPGAKLASMMCSTTLPRGDLCVSRTGSCSTASAAAAMAEEPA
jgi:hypothetical protein